MNKTYGETNSAIMPLIRFQCAVSKKPEMQQQCKYFKPGKRYPPGMFRLCECLGNWAEGFQMCNSIEAKEGFYKALPIKV